MRTGAARQLGRILVVGGVLIGVTGVPLSASAAPRNAIAPVLQDAPGPQTPVANPPIADSCGTNVVLVLDASGSIESSNAVDDVRDAGAAFLDALADTGSTARVLQFASVSEQLAGQAEVTAQSLQSGGVFRRAIDGYYSPKPPRPSGVTIYQYDGSGDPQSSSNYRESNGSNQYTNWDQSLDQAGVPQVKPVELVLYVTDGDPTAFDFNQPGDPFDAGPPPDVAISTDRGSAGQTTLDRAVQEANELKAAGARMLAVGVGNAVTGNASSRNRLIQIAGPLTVDDSGLDSIDSINDVDVALVEDFDTLAAFLRGVVNELCTPSLTVRKLAQTPGDAAYAPAPGWSITATPTVAGGGSYAWILPDTDSAERAQCGNPTNPNDQAPRTCATDSTGIASFQWEPDPSDAATSAVVTETLLPGYTAGQPDGPDWQCNLKNNDGSVDVQSGEFGQPALGFTLLVDPNQIITCSIWNSFNYAPQIELVKTDDPTQVRGDLPPPANTVTSTFTVTNPGNTPLSDVTVTDDRCTPAYQSGDTNADGLLAEANAETWTFTCTRDLTSSPGGTPLNVINSAEASGNDPTGNRVSATDDATVAVYAPAIDLTKSAAPTEVEVGVPTAVTYTYVATNTGNMTLTNVAVTDATGPATCAPVTPASVASLAPGGSATFTCTATLTADDPSATITNTATVIGDPVFPDGTPAPPAVTDQATAVVTVFRLGIALTKTVDRAVVFPGTEVTYSYTATNTGTEALTRPDPPPAPPADPRDGWIFDGIGPSGACAPVVYVSGDVDDDTILDVGEAWDYTCITTIDGRESTVRNTALVVAQSVSSGTRLTVFAQAVVEVVRPAITLEKAAVRPVVLDPLAPALGGPDVPLRTPAVYVYTVRNNGNVAVRDVSITDVYPSQGGNTCPVEPVPPTGANVGDTDANLVLDPGEGWEYQCVLGGADALTKADADDPPGSDPQLPSPVTNTASAAGEAFIVDGQIEQVFAVESNDATAQVLVISPGVSLTKTPCVDDGSGALTCADDLLARPGADVTYRYQVANTGDSALRPVAIADDRCDVMTFVGGDINGNDSIDGGTTPETWEYQCTAAANLPSPVENNAAVLLSGPLGNTFGAVADASVRLFEPAINLTKSVSAELVPVGSTVTYTFAVTNAGIAGDAGLPADLVLSSITLVDESEPANPSCSTPTFTGGDANGNDLLDLVPPETWVYECTAVINEFTIDVAEVTGTDVQGGPVVDTDSAAVTAFVAGIDVTKVAAPTLVVGSGPVTYSYAVTNTGNVPLSDVSGRITDDTCPTVTPVLVDGFNVGDFDRNNLLTGENDLFETGGPEVWEFTCTITVTADTLNTVTVVGTPVRPGADGLEVIAPDVTDQAQAQVTVVQPGTVTIIKSAVPEGGTTFSFVGTDPIASFDLIDDATGSEQRTFTGLAPGTFEVTETVPSGWWLQAITCVDPTGNTTTNLADDTATIQLGAGETVTCTFNNLYRATLPSTGLDTAARIILIALAVIAAGLALWVSAHRRRTT